VFNFNSTSLTVSTLIFIVSSSFWNLNFHFRSVAIPSNVMQVLKTERKQQLKYRMAIGENYQNYNFVCAWDEGRPLDPDYISKTFPKIREN